MGINKQSNIEANLQIGPTDIGMVRIYVSAGGTEIPMDFDPEEADEIAEEIMVRLKPLRSLLGSSNLQNILMLNFGVCKVTAIGIAAPMQTM